MWARSARNQRGVAFPSPVVILSVDRRGDGRRSPSSPPAAASPPSARSPRVRLAEQPTATPSADDADDRSPSRAEPPVDRSKVYVEVYNNSGITGLAGRVAATRHAARLAGRRRRQLVRHHPRHRPSTTPRRLKPRPKLLALDLGIRRQRRAVDPMRLDRLTVILTGPTRPDPERSTAPSGAPTGVHGRLQPWTSPPTRPPERYAALVRVAGERDRRAGLRRHPRAHRGRPPSRPTCIPKHPRC